ncbi:hypothetical protein PG993_000866 [Apiospora rasikravindrae]|uniref:Uncharacterized protein n=1 Tax=Apiospora rasikravindrae TaxID=990691 RepID=A0ABR1UCK0_9PEZI
MPLGELYRSPSFGVRHVMHQLSEALNYMYRNRGRGDTPRTQMQSIKSIHINYESRGPGATPNTGQAKNAFPTIRIANWDDSCMENDRRPQTTPGRFGQDPVEWEDAMGFGQILRCLLMAHVPVWRPGVNPCPNPGQRLDERPGFGWNHRPDSRRIAALPQPAGFQYSPQLLAMLQPFEIPGIQNTGTPFPGANPMGGPNPARNPMAGVTHQFPGCVPQNILANPILYETDINYIVNYMRPLAAAAMQGFRANNQAGFFTQCDVSWTRTVTVPFFCDWQQDPATNRTLRSLWRGALGQYRPPPERQQIHMQGARKPPR